MTREVRGPSQNPAPPTAGGPAAAATVPAAPVSEQTLDAPSMEVRRGRPQERDRPAHATVAELAYRYRWVLVGVGLLFLSLLLLLYARTRPGYDPYGWLVWGKLTIHL